MSDAAICPWPSGREENRQENQPQDNIERTLTEVCMRHPGVPANRASYSAGNEGLRRESGKVREKITMELSFPERGPKWARRDGVPGRGDRTHSDTERRAGVLREWPLGW